MKTPGRMHRCTTCGKKFPVDSHIGHSVGKKSSFSFAPGAVTFELRVVGLCTLAKGDEEIWYCSAECLGYCCSRCPGYQKGKDGLCKCGGES